MGMLFSYQLFASSSSHDDCQPKSVSGLNQNHGDDDCVVSFGTYHGPEYVTSATMGKPKCLIESKFLKVQQHRVALTTAAATSAAAAAAASKKTPPKSTMIDDWIFIDYHDRINVLVQAPGVGTEPHFYVFRQTKYALEDRMSLAVVGGMVEPYQDKSPEDAARREVKEEMHLTCQTFSFLGRFRTDVNRGAGWTFTYLAKDCHPDKHESGDGKAYQADEVGVRDTERQDLKTMSLSDIRKAVMQAEFLEIQWTATVALAVLQASVTSGE